MSCQYTQDKDGTDYWASVKPDWLWQEAGPCVVLHDIPENAGRWALTPVEFTVVPE